MTARKFLLLTPIAIALAACQNPPPISTAPIPTVAQTVSQDLGLQNTIQTDLADAQYDLQQAAQLGIIPATDPALTCLNALQGILNPTTPPKQFTPKIGGAASTGAVAYILAQQAKAASGGGLAGLVPSDCKALIGDILLKGLDATNKAALSVGTGGVLGGLGVTLP